MKLCPKCAMQASFKSTTSAISVLPFTMDQSSWLGYGAHSCVMEVFLVDIPAHSRKLHLANTARYRSSDRIPSNSDTRRCITSLSSSQIIHSI